MAKPLASGFELNEGSFGNLDEIMQVLIKAHKEDAIWKATFKNCKDSEDIHSWAMNIFPHRWKLPDTTIYTITRLLKPAAWRIKQGMIDFTTLKKIES